jgi:hypothetical protein
MAGLSLNVVCFPLVQCRLKAWFGPLLTDISFGELRSRDILSDSVARFYPVNVGDGSQLPKLELMGVVLINEWFN